jgi:membrane-anchored protein YejM (alkaline phosphatase superfamily)
VSVPNPAAARPEGAGYRFPALLWSLLHVPLILALYGSSIAEAVQATPERYRLPLLPTFLLQAALIGALAWVVTLPLALRPRLYRFAAPAVVALVASVLAVDSRVYQQVHFHLNGFFLRVAVQPDALRVTGVPLSQVVLVLVGAAAFVAADTLAGAWFVRRFAAPRRAWGLALALLLLGAAERVYGSGLTYVAGPAVFAASTVVPQVPVRMRTFYRRIFGERVVDQFAGQESLRLPVGVPSNEFRFTRKPDVLLVIGESLPADHFDAKTMPRLWRRVEEGGARFTRAYSGACSTTYSMFSLLYGLQPQKLERVVGAGGRAPLFGALRENGYQIRLLAASCLDWMEMRGTVFGDVPDEHVRNRCDSYQWESRDAKLFEDARELVSKADPDRPLFAFVFLFSTHFNYFYPESSAVHVPAWDGNAGLKTTDTPGWMIKNRAKNAAHGVDARLDEFLTWFEQERGRRPLVVFTGDHGEEFREKGHIGHGSAVTQEQIHVPLVVLGDGVPRGTFDRVVGHADVVPTLFSLLGDDHPPEQFSDGVSAFEAPADRFVLSTVGWEPRYALVGDDMKVVVYAGLAGMAVTDHDDRPLPDADARIAANAGRILRALRGESSDGGKTAAAAPQR